MGELFTLLPYNIVAGRLLEGFAAGLSLPLGFTYIRNTPAFGDIGRRISIFNSVFALGFVTGPLLITSLMKHSSTQRIFAVFGGIYIAFALLLAILFKEVPKPIEVTTAASTGRLQKNRERWFATFFTLFLAKTFYGFFLPFVTEHLVVKLAPLTIDRAMLVFSAIFIVGQGVASVISKRLPHEHLRVFLPLLLLASLLGMHLEHGVWFVFAAAILHSCLLFLGYLKASFEPGSAPEFAKLNSFSDPGLILGAAIAGLGLDGTYVIALFCAVPFVAAVFSPANLYRAEHFFPWIGPIGLFKVFAKQKRPIERVVDFPTANLDALSFDYARASTVDTEPPGSTSLTLAFCGDWAPRREGVTIDDELRAFIASHDVRAVNLEGTRTIAEYDSANDRSFYDMPESEWNAVIYGPHSASPLFNVVSFVNNHVLDRGGEAVDQTFANLAAKGDLTPVDRELAIRDVGGVRIGILARAFGANFFWRAHSRFAAIKPEELASGSQEGEAFLELVRACRKKVDLLILSYHWGYEAEYWPSGMQRTAWLKLKEAGVDILHGHHSHITQPFELSEDRSALCLYSLGNFSLEMPLPVYQQGGVASLRIEKVAGTWKVVSATMRFIEHTTNGLRLIDRENSIVHANWRSARTR